MIQLPTNPLMFASAAVMGAISSYLAYKRQKNPYLWFALGFLFGIFGIFAIFFFSSKKKAAQPKVQKPNLSIQGPRDKFWYYLDPSHQQKGPMSYSALTQAFKDGKVNSSTYVWYENLPEWKPLKDTLKSES